MGFNTIVLLLLMVLVISVGQVLFKLVSLSVTELSISGLLALLLNPYFIIAVGNYAVSTVLWVLILRTTDLSKAYPFVALSFVLVPAAGLIFFGEQLSFGLVCGMALILAGICSISFYG